jgi:hypothetical protein
MAYIYKSSNQEQAFFGDITEFLLVERIQELGEKA